MRVSKREMLERAGWTVLYQLRDDYGAFRAGYRLQCDSCQGATINGRACHETGCRRAPVECQECGEMVQRDDEHDCCGWS